VGSHLILSRHTNVTNGDSVLGSGIQPLQYGMPKIRQGLSNAKLSAKIVSTDNRRAIELHMGNETNNKS
jgi:hypothetical protein